MLGKITVNYSPNFTTSKRNTKNIKYLVFHYTGMSRESEAINRLINQSSKVSCHYYIKRNGQIILMVPEIYIAWHAGKSNWNKNSYLNKYSIGIEISNKGHQFGYEKFSKLQISSIIHLSRYLIKKYKIKKKMFWVTLILLFIERKIQVKSFLGNFYQGKELVFGMK